MKKTVIAALAAILCSVSAFGATRQHWMFDLGAGFSIGGAAPMPMPVEIREIKSFNPLFLPYLELNAIYMTDKSWGIMSGIRFEQKGMATVSRVKNYGMSISGDDGSQMSGNWTGTVETSMKCSYVSIPLLAVYDFGHKARVWGGLFGAFLMEGNFNGKVYDGYLREGNPTGDKINFSDGAKASYDFSEELAPFNYGLRIGADYKVKDRINLRFDLSWALGSVFKSSFKTINFPMYPIYASLGAGFSF